MAEAVESTERRPTAAEPATRAAPPPGRRPLPLPEADLVTTGLAQLFDGIVFTDAAGIVQLLNPAAEDLLGAKAFLVLHKPIAELEGRDDVVVPVRDDHRRALTDRDVTRTVELHHDAQDLLYVKVTTRCVTGHDGTVAGTITRLQDVTADYKSDQLKNQYLSIVAHELRTPLTGIKTFSTMLGKRVLGELTDKQAEVVEAIREQSRQLEHQIDKLINLGYLDSDDYGKDLETFDADEFVAQAATVFERPASDRGIAFGITCRSGARLRADRADLRRALQALIENAVKFTPGGGSVEVLGTCVDGCLRIAVRDAGIGIDPRYHRRIFEKFFQVEDPLTRHHGGAGLGLFVANQIVAAHGSRIEVKSELGKGAEFAFSLPVPDAVAATAEAAGGA